METLSAFAVGSFEFVVETLAWPRNAVGGIGRSCLLAEAVVVEQNTSDEE
ncbi:MAG: hypothetical protein INR62_11800 [Rhodospirillales bacterium]|nr:hypothetical protein [Acetobacter sp.]